MSALNKVTVEKLEEMKATIASMDFPQKDDIWGKLNHLQKSIDNADYLSFHSEVFNTIRHLIQAKRAVRKTTPGSKEYALIVSLILDLRVLMDVNDAVRAGILHAKGLAAEIRFFLYATVLFIIGVGLILSLGHRFFV